VEPDFLVCANGKWGIIEVDGSDWHPRERAAVDHERDRRFREHGVRVVERYDARECYDRELAAGVVAGFLRLLELNG
jgi:very-short-patch-repair endonuclease